VLNNYLVIAYRNLLKQKLYSGINILGLAIGLAICISMAIFVESELGYDKHINDHQNIYRTSLKMTVPGSPAQSFAQGSVYNAERFTNYFDEITEATRLRSMGATLGFGDTHFSDVGLTLADANVFNFMSLEMIKGDKQSALVQPNTVVLTESAARRYFSSIDVLDKTLILANRIPLKVTGIIKDLPKRTHLEFSAIVSMGTAAEFLQNPNWDTDQSFNYSTYFKLKPNTDIKALEARFPEFLENHIGEGLGDIFHYTLINITDIYLNSHLYGEMKKNGDINIVFSFSIIAALILLIACVNFMNLSTATATKRAKEVGVRKTLGAKKYSLVTQFMIEAIMLCYIALFIAIALVEATLPIFADFIGKTLSFSYLDLNTLSILLSLGLVVGLISGIYPAFYLSAFKPARVLKGEVTQGKTGALLRKGLVVFQFSVAIILIVATVIASMQLNYARNIELGYDKSNTFVLRGLWTTEASPQRDAIKTQLLANPDITSVTMTSRFPTGSLTDSMGLLHPATKEMQLMPVLAVDEDYFSSYNIKLLSGRGFSRDFTADAISQPSEENPNPEFSVVINSIAAKTLGYSPEEAVGKQFKVLFTRTSEGTATIVGVTEDYYFSSLKTEVAPTYHLLNHNNGSNMSIKYSGNTAQVRDYIEQTWSKFVPEQPIALDYLDDRFNQMYQQEDREFIVFNLFSLLAIFIACLGLFGLASFTTQRRTKEIGIRKVLGASVLDIVILINKEFSKQVLIANIIAWPAAYFIMQEWLNSFVYRIDLSILPFAVATALAFVIAWVTVGSLSAIAAKERPITALRYE
jgi:putative ABC transport system permease protein